MKTWTFKAMDTWYFRESRGHDSLGGQELASVFPPPGRTLIGAVRTALGEAMGIDWARYKANESDSTTANVRELIGHGDDLGQLHVTGPRLFFNDQSLHPCPLNLLARGTPGDSNSELRRLGLGRPLNSHLGRVQAPALPKGAAGFKALEGYWITAAGLERLFAGETPPADSLIPEQALTAVEPRLGIALKPGARTVDDGALYQTRHLRPCAGLRVQLGVEGADTETPAAGLLRIGGEGRAAAYATDAPPLDLPKPPEPQAGDVGLLLTLLTPALLDGRAWLPPGFIAATDERGLTVWRGEIAGIGLQIHGAVLGKVQREGGWDLLKRRPRPIRNLTPAGSLWYCRVPDGDLASAVQALHGVRIGADIQMGYGQLAIGRWPSNELENID